MRASFSKLAFAVVVAVPLLAANAAAAESLRLAGTGGIIEAMKQIAPSFKAATGNELEITVGLGSGGALRALADGKLDVVVSARALNPDEAKLKLVARPFARTPLVFITSHPKPNGLRSSDIAKIFALADPKWEDGTPLKIILRTRLDSDTALIERDIPAVKEAIEGARRRPDVPVAATDQDNVEFAQRVGGSFSLAGYGQIIAEKCNLRMIAIDGVMPNLGTMTNKTYPYEKMFYLVFASERSAGAEQFLKFLRSAESGKVLLATGNLPVGE
jgi:phosphate transport system substrate-binding protein